MDPQREADPEPAAPDGATCALAEQLATPQPALRLRFEDGREIPLERQIQIGTAPANDLVLDDPFVSAVHCVIVRQAGRTLLKDLGSRNGCWLGAARVRLVELAPGARLTLGGTTCDVLAVDDERHPILGTSAAVARLRRELTRVGPTELPVLLLGESGTGKELAARALHEASGRRGALVPVNCGALSPELVESELFGHERGAFTGAAARRAGLFEEADRGTLFLDEIGELPLELQPKLLRALESGKVRPVGGSAERRINVRVIAATHRNLAVAMERGEFRLDLYHRLATIEIRLPALRERPEDIRLLAHHFLATDGGGAARSFSPASLEAMLRHRWPGNVRELRNAVVRAAHLGGTVIEPDDLFPPRPLPPPSPGTSPFPSLFDNLPALGAAGETRGTMPMDEVQRQVVIHALRQHRGSIRAAARALGLPHSTLHDRVKRWKLA